MNERNVIVIEAREWVALVSRVAALETRDADLAGQIHTLRAAWDRMESRLYAIVATGTIGGAAASYAATTTFGG